MAWSKGEKPTDSFSKVVKPTTSFSKATKPSSSFSRGEKPSADWGGSGKFIPDFLLLETGAYLLLQSEGKIIINQLLQNSWSKVAKP